MQINWLSVALFGLLGYLLDRAGVGLNDKPEDFLMILATVVAIDFVAGINARK